MTKSKQFPPSLRTKGNLKRSPRSRFSRQQIGFCIPWLVSLSSFSHNTIIFCFSLWSTQSFLHLRQYSELVWVVFFLSLIHGRFPQFLKQKKQLLQLFLPKCHGRETASSKMMLNQQSNNCSSEAGTFLSEVQHRRQMAQQPSSPELWFQIQSPTKPPH